jgi:hypothetical protein
MKRAALLLALVALLAVQANAQKRGGSPANYETAIGARVNPWLIGFTIKHFLQGPHAIEGLATTNFSRNGNLTLTGLYEYHFNFIPSQPEWVMYAGGGAHIGFYDRYDWDRSRWDRDGDGTYVTAGLDGIFGVEYTFKNIPLNLSADVKPYFHFSGGNNFYGESITGVSARYTF